MERTVTDFIVGVFGRKRGPRTKVVIRFRERETKGGGGGSPARRGRKIKEKDFDGAPCEHSGGQPVVMSPIGGSEELGGGAKRTSWKTPPLVSQLRVGKGKVALVRRRQSKRKD